MYNEQKEYLKNPVLRLIDCNLTECVDKSLLSDNMPNWKQKMIEDRIMYT